MSKTADKLFGKKPSFPETYPGDTPLGVATKQGDYNLDAANATAGVNRADQITPLGDRKWVFDPETNKWASQDTLSPEAQAGVDLSLGLRNDALNNLKQSLYNTPQPPAQTDMEEINDRTRGYYNDFSGTSDGATQAASVSNSYMQPAYQDVSNVKLDYSNLPGMPSASDATRKAVEDALYARATSRLDPRFANAESSMHTRLANMGLTMGSEAYEKELERLGRERTDAYAAATNDSILAGTRALESQFGLQMSKRQQAVNEANSQFAAPLQKLGVLSNANTNSNQVASYWQALRDQQENSKSANARANLGAVSNERQRTFDNDRVTDLTEYNKNLQTADATRDFKQVYFPDFTNTNVGASVAPNPYLDALLADANIRLGGYNSKIDQRNNRIKNTTDIATAILGF